MKGHMEEYGLKLGKNLTDPNNFISHRRRDSFLVKIRSCILLLMGHPNIGKEIDKKEDPTTGQFLKIALGLLHPSVIKASS